MEAQHRNTTSSGDWEREFAPRVSGAYQAGVISIYALWLAFLIAMAVHRWFLTLQ